ncbi:MAG: hypothetical protein A4E62_01398 [Syntrophorhabdus sp. PtaU1.Bin002]|nr:MAG: hypothetical protein A4E58_03173 [Syntrophorhabdus sp. PtaB.Bin006]OPY71229.1 MAG: hypothetical protein A4E62_01398 [Syntrophorhabdus sp. PtaU1.Bin002]
MKRTAITALALAMSFVFLASMAFSEELKYSGFLGDYYKVLQPGPEGGAKERWLKPGVDFARYNKFMIHSVIFFFADDSEYKGIDPDELKDLADGFNKAIKTAFKDKYPMVTEPGPDVARIRFAITGVKQTKPILSGVSSVLPIGFVISAAKKGATGAWTGSGATSAEVMVLDTMSNDVVAVAVDQKTAGFSERLGKWQSAELAFKFWAERLVKMIDDAKATGAKK